MAEWIKADGSRPVVPDGFDEDVMWAWCPKHKSRSEHPVSLIPVQDLGAPWQYQLIPYPEKPEPPEA